MVVLAALVLAVRSILLAGVAGLVPAQAFRVAREAPLLAVVALARVAHKARQVVALSPVVPEAVAAQALQAARVQQVKSIFGTNRHERPRGHS